MIKKVSFIFIAIMRIALVVYLGFLSTSNSTYVVWFGLASAFLAPLSLTLLTSVFNLDQKKALNKLLKIADIDSLVQKAETQEEKVQILQNQRKHLMEIIEYETTKYAALKRKESLLNEAEKLIDEIDNIETEIATLKLDNEENMVTQTIDKLNIRLEKRRDMDQSPSLVAAIYAITLSLPIPSFMSGIIMLIANSFLRLLNGKEKKKKP